MKKLNKKKKIFESLRILLNKITIDLETQINQRSFKLKNKRKK